MRAKQITRFLINFCKLIELDRQTSKSIQSDWLHAHATEAAKLFLKPGFRVICIGDKYIETKKDGQHWAVTVKDLRGEELDLPLYSSNRGTAALNIVGCILDLSKGFQTHQESLVEGMGLEARAALEQRASSVYKKMKGGARVPAT
jgi:hypothetical protein